MENKVRTGIEYIKVFILYDKYGNTKCICSQNRKLCENKRCSKEIVERDKFRGWESTFKVNKYGK